MALIISEGLSPPLLALGANRPQDAVYPTSLVDGDGKPYDGANKYVLHFPKGQTPPAKGFWSLTMYDGDYFFVANPLNRYTLSPRNALKYNEDGSLDLFIQKDSRRGERIELATRSCWQIHSDATALLAAGNGSVDP